MNHGKLKSTYARIDRWLLVTLSSLQKNKTQEKGISREAIHGIEVTRCMAWKPETYGWSCYDGGDKAERADRKHDEAKTLTSPPE